MKTLLLASNGAAVMDNISMVIRGRQLKDLRIAYITTAGKDVPDASYLERSRVRMRELGFLFEEMDIEGKNEETLRTMLKEFDAVYVEGGNTFYLLKAVRESGFGKVIRERIDKGLVYIGASAGAYIACPTIEMATWMDRNKFNRHSLADFTALNLVPFLIFAHYDSYNLQDQNVIKEQADMSKYPVRILKDGQALLVEDNNIQLVGDELKIVL